jgi:hypothetical protein
MRSLHAQPDVELGVKEARTITIDCTRSLASGETLGSVSGSDSYGNTRGASVSDSKLQYETPVVNTGTVTSLLTNETIAVGKAIQIRLIAKNCRVGETYTAEIVVATSAGDTMQIKQDVKII